jgi:hypothetical protein
VELANVRNVAFGFAGQLVRCHNGQAMGSVYRDEAIGIAAVIKFAGAAKEQSRVRVLRLKMIFDQVGGRDVDGFAQALQRHLFVAGQHETEGSDHVILPPRPQSQFETGLYQLLKPRALLQRFRQLCRCLGRAGNQKRQTCVKDCSLAHFSGTNHAFLSIRANGDPK